jgi:hypothetical protein
MGRRRSAFCGSRSNATQGKRLRAVREGSPCRQPGLAKEADTEENTRAYGVIVAFVIERNVRFQAWTRRHPRPVAELRLASSPSP